ncbi:hypothetical protein ACQKIE_18965 [Luteibacter sp. NPDC031894]|uniref:hypothetical protein n=1 Tax=Luteibacter sp. NPDC031894 TaxID=3390572 RepID=UPI003D01A17C
MKLKTQRHETHGYPVFFTACRANVEHDAAMAHALVQAIRTHCHEVFCDRIEETADEILAEWGYGDGCG